MIVTLSEAKSYLRVDSSDEDSFITQLIDTAEHLVCDVARVSNDVLSEEDETVRIAELYTVAYLYEHREEADHKELLVTLKNLLFGIREELF